MFFGLGSYLDYLAEDWLYGKYDQDKLDQFTLLYSNSLIRSYIDYKLDKRANAEYMKNNQLSYSDIHDPRKLSQVRSGASYYGSTYRMVSQNVNRLYR